ncbi:MAG: CDP-diacylglycerol--glycerol-3-phosphate 3-phosphatidyltransferase [Verrucomicrobiota bacterium]
MNLPNQLSLARLGLCALLVAAMSFDWPYAATAALALFALASLTDWLDGYIARKHNLVTDLGKLLDPLADKIMVSAAFIVLIERGVAPMWMVVVIIAREFLITGLRMVAANKQYVLAAERAGKHKTVTQILAILASFAYLSLREFGFAETGAGQLLGGLLLPLYWVALVITVWSGAQYFAKNRGLFQQVEASSGDDEAEPREPDSPKQKEREKQRVIRAKQAAAIPGPILDPQVGTVDHVHEMLELEKEVAPVLAAPAFKEWHVIVEALGAGEQWLILRKGGIAEGRGGFRPEYERFWLFPTQYHEQLAQTKPAAAAYARLDPPSNTEIPLKYLAQVTDAVFLEDADSLEALDRFHLWQPEVIRERFDWSKQIGVHLLVLRVYRVRHPHRLKASPDFGGCKSWITVPAELETECVPVMADEEFRTRRSRLLAAVPAAAR